MPDRLLLFELAPAAAAHLRQRVADEGRELAGPVAAIRVDQRMGLHAEHAGHGPERPVLDHAVGPQHAAVVTQQANQRRQGIGRALPFQLGLFNRRVVLGPGVRRSRSARPATLGGPRRGRRARPSRAPRPLAAGYIRGGHGARQSTPDAAQCPRRPVTAPEVRCRCPKTWHGSIPDGVMYPSSPQRSGAAPWPYGETTHRA